MLRPIPLALLALALAAPARAQQTVLLSQSGGIVGNALSAYPVGDWDGSRFVFQSYASNLVPNDGNALRDLFLCDPSSGAIERLSVDPAGNDADGPSRAASLGWDGRLVAFESEATNLVAHDTNAQPDIFVRDLALGVTHLVSRAADGTQGDGPSLVPYLAGHGRWVAFTSAATNLVPGDTNGCDDVFVRDLASGAIERASVGPNGLEADAASFATAISCDGRFVCFTSSATNLVAGDTNALSDVFVRDRLSGTTARVSLGAGGVQGDGPSSFGALSADGRSVAFQSLATNLVAGDTNGTSDVFVRDLAGGEVLRASCAASGGESHGTALAPSLSADGRFVCFASDAPDLVPGDANALSDVFVRDLVDGTLERVSVTGVGAEANSGSFFPALTPDGRWVGFGSFATNLAFNDSNGIEDAFARDRGGWPHASFCHDDPFAPLACPCTNAGAFGRGCENSSVAAGAELAAAGEAVPDSVVFSAWGLPRGTSALVVQGTGPLALQVGWGDGVRCIGGALERLYVASANGGRIDVPGPGDPSVSARSAQLGDPLGAGTTRVYQVLYRDPAPGFCPAGGGFNATNALSIVW